MRRRLPWPWLLAGLFVLGSGCQNLHRMSSNDAVPEGFAPSAAADDLPGGQPPPSLRVRPALPVTTWTRSDAPPARGQLVRLERPTPTPLIQEVKWQPTAFHPCEAVHLVRPMPTPLVVAPASLSAYGHAPNYQWLVGCLHYDQSHERWSVHYANAESDVHDGVLELLNPGPMTGFCPGQIVRVEGELVDPAPLEIKPAYRVASVQVLRR